MFPPFSKLLFFEKEEANYLKNKIIQKAILIKKIAYKYLMHKINFK